MTPEKDITEVLAFSNKPRTDEKDLSAYDLNSPDLVSHDEAYKQLWY